MVLLIYFLANLAILLYFLKFQRENLFPLEIFTYWIVSTIVFQNYSAFFYMNIKHFIIHENLSIEMTHLINRIVLIPVITLIFLNNYVNLTTIKKKIAFIFLIIIIFGCIEMLSHITGVLIHKNWNFWWSLIFWFIYILIAILLLKYFRIKMAKGVYRP